MQQDDRIFAAVGACVIVGVTLAAAVMWLASGISVEAPQRATVAVNRLEAPNQATSLPANPEVVEASLNLDGDDSLIRSSLARLSSHPRFAEYLVNDRLLRRFVGTVDAIAGGYNPRDEVDFMRPVSDFMVREDEGRLVIAAGSFRRYAVVADTFASIDSAGSAELYRRLSPKLEAVYQEIGWGSDSFDDRLREAIDHLLEVEVPGGPIEVEQRSIVYAFAEDEFEGLTAAQKLLVRMGDSNARKVQNKLIELRQAFGWPDRTIPVVTAELEMPQEPEMIREPIVADASSIVSPDPIEERIGAPEVP